MRVVTWNTRHGRPKRGFTSNRKLAEVVAELGADVLAVQEVDRRVIRSWFADQPALIANASGAIASDYAPARRLAITGDDGVALCVRGDARFRRLRLPHRWGQPRVALIGSTPDATFVTTHLQNQSDEARSQLDWLLEEVAPLPRPCVLLGDLNLRPEDITDRLAAAGFTVAGGGPTEPAWAPHQRIDHVAVDGMAVGTVSIAAVAVSDHRPLIVELN
ncbi:MAG TPA: endonuclease/exonuclease/phosphatase family protein [Jatrophihabitantaceae bacterium]|nr:endonuclease/exonuclease/phosphatase family protein [Jatrophihabitantaceae bacterium]